MVVLQADGSVMAGAGGGGVQRGGRGQVPPTGGSNQLPPEQSLPAPNSPNQARGTVSPPPASCPPQPQGPSVMLIWMWGGQPERGSPSPQGTAQQFQKNRDLYS